MTIIAYHYGFESERLAEATRASCAGMRSAFKLRRGRKRTRTFPPRGWAPAIMCGAHGRTRTCHGPPRLHGHGSAGARRAVPAACDARAGPPRPRHLAQGIAARSAAAHASILLALATGCGGALRAPRAAQTRLGLAGAPALARRRALRPLTGRSDLSRRRALRPLASPPPSYAGRRSRRTQRCRAPRRPKLPSVRAASRRRRGPPNRPVTSQESRTGRGPRLPRRTWPRQDRSLWPGARAYGVRSSSKMQPAESARTPEPAVAGRGKTDRGRRRAGFPAVARPAPARPLRAMRAGGAPGGAPEHCPRSGGR